MTDLELTKLCAAAMGYAPATYVDGLDLMFRNGTQYAPLYNGEQCFGMVTRFGLTIGCMDDKKRGTHHSMCMTERMQIPQVAQYANASPSNNQRKRNEQRYQDRNHEMHLYPSVSG